MIRCVYSWLYLFSFDVHHSCGAFQKRRKTKAINTASNSSNGELAPAVRDKMKKAFAECHRAVLACEDDTGRKRCELFRDLPDKRVSTEDLPPPKRR